MLLPLMLHIALLVLVCFSGIPAFANSIDDLKAGVVKITATVGNKTRVGTGIIVGLDTHSVEIVTASHVIEGSAAPQIEFFTKPNRSFPSRVIGLEGGDPKGLAALLVEGNFPSGLRALTLDPTVQVKGGEPVRLIGFPRTLNTAWAVITGSLSGLRGREITVQAPASEGNSGGPLIFDNKVIGVITGARGQFAYAVPAVIAQFALSSWGVHLSKVSPPTPPTKPNQAQDDIDQELAAIEAEMKAEEELAKLQTAKAASVVPDISGTWKNSINPLLSYEFEQEESSFRVVEITMNLFNSIITAEGQGRIEGHKILFSFITLDGTSGQAEMVLSQDKETLKGNLVDLSTGYKVPLSIEREP